MRYNNLAEMFFSTADKFASRNAYMYKPENMYVPVTFAQARADVEKIAAGLISLGIKPGDKIAILSQNRFEWALTDYAILSVGAVTVPIYPSLLPEQMKYLFIDSESKVLFCSDQELFNKVNSIRSSCPMLENVVVFDKIESGNSHLPYEELKKNGETLLQNNSNAVAERIKNVKPNDIATIIYTSGTTGEPKGALLMHSNFLSNVESALTCLHVDETDMFLSFLPLSHVFERMAGHFLATWTGGTISYAVSIDSVAENMGEVHPTVMTSVPRLYEKIYARVLESVEAGSPVKRKIFYWAIKVGRDYVNCIMKKQPISSGLNFKRNLAYKLVFAKLAERVGGKLRFFISGGAPLAKEIGEFFGAAGLMIYEGYGLTETSPVITVNKTELFKFGTVGEPIPGVEVKIAEDGEILTRGPHVMVGYYKKEEETREVIDADNWFYTGDIGFIDEDGCLTITDRKKNILVTSGGKNIAPQPIENKLVTKKFIEQAVIIGDRRKFCSAVIVPAFEPLEKWAVENEIKFNSPADLVKMPKVKELIKKDVDEVNSHLASYETIKEFVLADKSFSIETGELTPSLKVKRKVVIEKFADEIEKIYAV